jgi:TonB family protein
MGLVYKALDRTLGEIVAVKALLPGVDLSPEVLKRFREEAKLARRVRHRNVCAIHSYEEDGDIPFIVMELVEGTDLKRFLQKVGAMEWDDGFDVALQVAEGLAAIHEVGVVHRDLKPANITRDDRGVVRVMDFGIAKGGTHAGLTDDGKVVCTIDYVSPEQLLSLDVDPRSDLYSFGVVLYELFTGRVPFKGDTPAATMRKHLEEPPPLQGVAADLIPRSLVPVLERALAKNRRDRFADAAAMRSALQHAREEMRRRGTDPISSDDPRGFAPAPLRAASGPYPKEARLLVPTLRRALRHGDRVVRLGAAQALKRTPDPAARDALTAALADQDREVRERAAEALEMLAKEPVARGQGAPPASPAPPGGSPPPNAPVRAGPEALGTSPMAGVLEPTSDLKVEARPEVRPPMPAVPASRRPAWLPWGLGLAVVLAGLLVYALLQRRAPEVSLPTPPRPTPTVSSPPIVIASASPEATPSLAPPALALPDSSLRPSPRPATTTTLPAPPTTAPASTSTLPLPTLPPEPPPAIAAATPPPASLPTPAPTPPPPAPGSLVEIGDPALTRPTCVTCPPPQLPLIALSPTYEPVWRKTGGLVELAVLVDETGSVAEVKPTKGDRALVDAAVKTVRRWRYRAAEKQGVKVKVWLTVPVQFTPPR